MKDPPKHAYIHIEILRQHGKELKNDIDISIKYPMIGPSKNFDENRPPFDVKEFEKEHLLSDLQDHQR